MQHLQEYKTCTVITASPSLVILVRKVFLFIETIEINSKFPKNPLTHSIEINESYVSAFNKLRSINRHFRIFAPLHPQQDHNPGMVSINNPQHPHHPSYFIDDHFEDGVNSEINDEGQQIAGITTNGRLLKFHDNRVELLLFPHLFPDGRRVIEAKKSTLVKLLLFHIDNRFRMDFRWIIYRFEIVCRSIIFYYQSKVLPLWSKNSPELTTQGLFNNVAYNESNVKSIPPIDAQDTYQEVENQTGTMAKLANDLLMLEATLLLKLNCRVMLRKNLDVERGLVNGAIGIVHSIFPNHIMVQFTHLNEPITIYQHQERTTILGNAYIRKQYPLSLAYSMTIHKCQGLTISKVVMWRHGCFDYGQAYVGLSRVRNIASIRFMGWLSGQFQADPNAVNFYNSWHNQNSLQE
jgi:hypothetical protein